SRRAARSLRWWRDAPKSRSPRTWTAASSPSRGMPARWSSPTTRAAPGEARSRLGDAWHGIKASATTRCGAAFSAFATSSRTACARALPPRRADPEEGRESDDGADTFRRLTTPVSEDEELAAHRPREDPGIPPGEPLPGRHRGDRERLLRERRRPGRGRGGGGGDDRGIPGGTTQLPGMVGVREPLSRYAGAPAARGRDP